jgi:hypothetical protein
MNGKEKRVLLVITGVGLVAGGHKLMNAELGKLGAPHVVGAVLLALALKE